jgi:hypothetical protein
MTVTPANPSNVVITASQELKSKLRILQADLRAHEPRTQWGFLPPRNREAKPPNY